MLGCKRSSVRLVVVLGLWFRVASGSANGVGVGIEGDTAVCKPSSDCGEVYDAEARCGLSTCEFARQCGDGDANPYLTSYECRVGGPVGQIFFLVLLFLWMILLFMLLGSTADDFFAPTLDQFSRDLGLPPRFAGVTLLALGNGAPDASATVSAIGQGGEGYHLSLGALTGAGMFVGTIVAGAVMLYSGGVAARGALFRDLTTYVAACVLVAGIFASGEVSVVHVAMLLVFYIAFVFVVLAADIYHRQVVVPKANRDMQQRAERMFLELESWDRRVGDEPSEADSAADRSASDGAIPRPSGDGPDALDASHPSPPSTRRASFRESFVSDFGSDATTQAEASGPDLSSFGNILDSLSNYAGDEDADDGGRTPQPSGWADDYMVIKGDRNASDYAFVFDDDNDEDEEDGSVYVRMGGEDEDADRFGSLGNSDSAVDLTLRQEIQRSWTMEVDAVKEQSAVEQALWAVELPFSLARRFTIPRTSPEVYARADLVVSIALLPLWLCYYYGLFNSRLGFMPMPLLLFLVALPTAAALRRFTRSGQPVRPPALAATLALLGFAVAAMWIDVLADALVNVLQLFGLCLGVPGSVLGLTLLAWGNSIGDLSTNISMAKRGLANMAITACFAGPVFNLLVGLGVGFGLELQATGKSSISVELPSEIAVGFGFIVATCLGMMTCGLACRGRVPTAYGYVGLALYVIYLIVVMCLSFA